jgi:hypothetical protein
MRKSRTHTCSFDSAQEEGTILENGRLLRSRRVFRCKIIFISPAKLELPTWVVSSTEVILFVTIHQPSTDAQLPKRNIIGVSKNIQKLVDGGSVPGLHDEPYGACPRD